VSAEGRYEVVIGLEVHTHLRTRSKLFSPAPVAYGAAPNHAVHPIDLGLPGVLPVLNEAVVDLAIALGLAIEGEIDQRSVFSRKNYFYPDLPKGYQISQYDQPIVANGRIEIELSEGPEGSVRRKTVGITRAHLEEDAGKSLHGIASMGGDESWIDLNRAGVPLLEIVSEPELRSAEEAVAYLRALRSILRYTGVSDADMEKGQFRCDANVSLREPGARELGTRTEIKNLNSFSNVDAAIRAEMRRQAELLDEGGRVVQATMGFDAEKGRTHVQRSKENADDYRYFDDPDLIPLAIPDERIERVRAALPELPAQKRARFESEHGLPAADADTLTASRGLADFFEAVARAHGDARVAANWMLRDVLAALKEREIEIEELPVAPDALARLLRLVDEGRATARSAREVFAAMAERGGDPEAILRERGLEAFQDSGVVEAAVDEVVAECPEEARRFGEGDDKVLNFLMGQVMKRTRGKAEPGAVRELFVAKLRGGG